MRTDDTMKYLVLKFIYQSGEKGVRYTDIVRYIVEELHDRKYNYEFDRGYWSSQLSGTYKQRGILEEYCTKNKQNRWIISNKKLISYFKSREKDGTIDIPYQESRAKAVGISREDYRAKKDLGMDVEAIISNLEKYQRGDDDWIKYVDVSDLDNLDI